MSFRRFFQTMLAAAFITAAIVSLINVDYLIAKENIGRFLNDKKSLDMDYLASLSRDAAPAHSELVRPNNFETLNISQKLAFSDAVDRYTHENASSTAYAYTLSKKRSQKFLNALPEEVKISIQNAKAKDKRYEIQSREVNNQAAYNPNPCIATTLNEVPAFPAEKMEPYSIAPYKNTNCVDLPPNANRQIQAQLITVLVEPKGELRQRVAYNNYEYIYAVVSYNPATKQSSVLYKKDLPITESERATGAINTSYILQNSGNLIESDYNNRDYYIHGLVTDGGYRLGDKKLY